MKNTKYKYYVFILAIGLIVLFCFNYYLQVDLQRIIYPDSGGYHDAAKSLYLHAKGQNCRPILLALIQGFPYVFGASDQDIFHCSFYINLFCWLGFSLVLFETLSDYFSLKIAFLTSIFPFFIFNNLTVIYHLLSENVFMFFTVVGFYFLSKFFLQKQYWQLALSLSIFIASMLIRPGAKIFAIIMLLFFAKILIQNYKHRATIFVYLSLSMVLVQCAGLKYQFGNFTISYIDIITYHNYLGSQAISLKKGVKFDQYKNARADYLYNYQSEFQVPIVVEDLKNQLRNNKINLLKAYLIDVWDNSTSGSLCVADCKNIKKIKNFELFKNTVLIISKYQNYLFSIIGFLLSISVIVIFFKTRNIFFYFALYILYTIITAGISCQQGDRFHAVIFPYVMILIFFLMHITKKISFANAAPLQK